MNKIRIGNDIPIRWSIMTGVKGSEEQYDLTGKNLSLWIRGVDCVEKPLEFTTEGNVVISTFYGKDQRLIGKYTIILKENANEEDMKTLDECQAFELVDCSCKQTNADSGNIEIGEVDIHGALPVLSIVIDSVLSEDSLNPIQNKAVAVAIRETNEIVALKQDAILDLDEIREGAQKGQTAVQDVSNLATKVELSEGLLTRIAKSDILQELGYHTDKVISQNASLKMYSDLATLIATKLNKSSVVQSTGGAKDLVISQDAITTLLLKKQDKLTPGVGIEIDGNVIRCTATGTSDIFIVVAELPEAGEDNHIYLVPAEQPSESDLFDEWIWQDGWERIGSVKIDLSGYATKAYVDESIASALGDVETILNTING